MSYECPSCGAPFTFKSGISVYTTCTYCGAKIVRHDRNFEVMGKEAFLLNDMSPFQVGTFGTYDNMMFELLGRIKIMWSHGTWSEWYALFEGGREGWLAEAQGLYMMSFPQDPAGAFPAKGSLKVGDTLEAGGHAYEVDDIREVSYHACEGELPFVFQKDYKALSVDFVGPEARFANILYGPEEPKLYVGKYEPFESFNFQNIRQLDGWKL